MCRKLANTRLSRVVSRDYVRHLADFPSFLEIQSACPIRSPICYPVKFTRISGFTLYF